MKIAIDENEVIQFTRRLIQIPTVNPPADTRVCAGYIARTLTEEGINAEISEGRDGLCNVVARLCGKEEGKTLVLNGHIDVVAPGEGWTVDPFGGEVRIGRIYGRGASDMKSGLAAMMGAMIGVKRSGLEFKGEIVFMAVADEETGSEYGTRYLLDKGVGKGAAFGIVCEPTNLRVETGNRGLRWIDIEVRGKASHAGRPRARN